MIVTERGVISWPCAARAGASLKELCHMGVGGSVEWLLEPADPEELRAAILRSREHGFVPRILGGGANLVVADGLHRGVVIATARMNRVMRPLTRAASSGDCLAEEIDARVAPLPVEEDPRLVCWAGASMPGLVSKMRRLGLAGLEMLAGVPGHIGGGVAMNAGGRGWEIWNSVDLVRTVTPEGQFKDLTRKEACPTYRNGNLGELVVAGVVMSFEPTDKALVEARISEYLRAKNQAQPVTQKSAGCIFKNPDMEQSGGRTAGQLIEDCGLKGLSLGGARVSEKHANFIVNLGQAQANEVLALMERVREEVQQRAGLSLEFEVKRWLLSGADPARMDH